MNTSDPNTTDKPKFSLQSIIKKYFWFIVIFLLISITSGVLLADHEAKSTTNWQTFTSKEAGVSFKYPKSYKIVEDKGWRITIYTNPGNTEDNIKIVYLPQDENNSIESQFLANCQPAKVNTVDANSTPIKVYEGNTCGEQKIDTAVIVNTENGINYDITLFGKTNLSQLYRFLSTFAFTKPTNASSQNDTSTTDWKTYTNYELGYQFKYPPNFYVKTFTKFPKSIFLSTDDQPLHSLEGPTAPFEITLINETEMQRIIKDSKSDSNFKDETIEINHFKTRKISGHASGYLEADYAYVFVPQYDQFNLITYYGYDEKFSKEQFNQILSTFKLVINPPQLPLCGGIAAIQCPAGYSCKLDGDYPDAGGTCYKNKGKGVMCTMDAKQCPDGSWVGRSGPNCEFKCPK